MEPGLEITEVSEYTKGHDKERPCGLSTAFISDCYGSDCIFAWDFFTEGWLLRKDFAMSAALYLTSDRK
jgi:hypothetical protein